MSEALRQEFLRALVAPAEARQEAADRDRDFVRALLAFGSETEDNRQCVERIGIRDISPQDATPRTDSTPTDSTRTDSTRTDSTRTGAALRRSGIPVADLLNAAEGTPLPTQLAEDFPAVTQDDWDAVLRLATLLFVAAESPAAPAEPS